MGYQSGNAFWGEAAIPAGPTGRRSALYHRVSTIEQDASGAGDALRAAARQRGLEVVLEIEETGSGARNDRPGLNRLLDMAARGELDVVLVWKLDRFGRSALDLLANLRRLEDCGVRFVAVTQGIDLKPDGDAMSRLMTTMLSAIAEFERELIKERTRHGMQRAKARGVRLGRKPGKQPDPQRVAALRARGWSWKAVAAELGFPIAACRRAVGATR
jgi:putative DNA-invertase from lambdoid prophage Rac